MHSFNRPKVSLLEKTNLDPNSYHSILISLCRGLAALEVAAAHVRTQAFPSLRTLPDPGIWYQGLAFFTGFAHQAVVIFFLLSGWLVGGSLLNKLNTPNPFLSYSIDRITRLWIVLIPSFLATLAFAAWSDWIDATKFDYSPSNEYSFSSFFGNLVGLQDVAVPRFGGNFALWSLACETWYYVLFPLVLASFAAKKLVGKIAAAILTVFIAANLSNVLMLYFSLWLLGTAFSRIQIALCQRSKMLLISIFVVTAVYSRLNEESFLQDLLYSLLFLTLLSSQQQKLKNSSPTINWLRSTGTILSNFSFTLYVIHVPLLRWLLYINKSMFGIDKLSPEEPSHYAIYFAMLTLIVLFSYLFYLAFEANTYKVRAYIKKTILSWLSRRPGGSIPKAGTPNR